MIFFGTQQECTEALAQVNARLGYPRGYTEADVGVLVHRRGKGPWAPIESIRTETAAGVDPVDVDDDGQPTSARRVVRFRLSADAPRRDVARARVLRLVNRGTRAALMAVPGIGGTRANATIAPGAGPADVDRGPPRRAARARGAGTPRLRAHADGRRRPGRGDMSAGRYDILAEHRARHSHGEQIDAGDAADPPSDPGAEFA